MSHGCRVLTGKVKGERKKGVKNDQNRLYLTKKIKAKTQTATATTTTTANKIKQVDLNYLKRRRVESRLKMISNLGFCSLYKVENNI